MRQCSQWEHVIVQCQSQVYLHNNHERLGGCASQTSTGDLSIFGQMSLVEEQQSRQRKGRNGLSKALEAGKSG